MTLNRSFITILFILLLLSITSPRTALADVAPPEPPVGSNLEPGAETTNVRMMSETVTIDVPTYSEHETHQATVTAVFQMRNLGEAEERMDVRFPLCSAAPGQMELTLDFFYQLPAIENFKVWINDAAALVTKSYESYSKFNFDNLDNEIKFIVPCWANFPVIFPPGVDVNIRVQYVQVGGFGGNGHGTSKFPKISYILFTGSGWKDTIGQADIIAHLPLDAETLHASPNPEAVVSGKEIRWHFEDFEPGGRENELRGIEFEFLKPKLRLKIEEERANTTKNPEDGNAWGRLGKALKYAYRLEEGFFDEASYWESAAAYQKAVALLPDDVAWRYGYADLVCFNVADPRGTRVYNRHPNDTLEPLRLCVDQVTAVLKLDPQHLEANEIIEMFKRERLVDLSGPEPMYLILTPTMTPTYTATRRPTVTETPDATATVQPSLTPTVTRTTVPTFAPTLVQASTVETTEAQKRSPLCGAALLPGMAAVVLWLFRSRAIRL